MNFLYGFAISLHMGLDGSYNEFHPHIRLHQSHFIAGLYYNSENNISPYIGSRWSSDLGYFEYGMVGGYLEPLPFARLGLNIDNSRSLFLAPALEKIGGSTKVGATLGFEIMY